MRNEVWPALRLLPSVPIRPNSQRKSPKFTETLHNRDRLFTSRFVIPASYRPAVDRPTKKISVSSERGLTSMVYGVFLLSSSFSSSSVILLFYTDPGTGSLIWQLLLASVIGGVFYVRHVARRVKERFAAHKRNNSSAEFVNQTDSESAH